MTDDTPEPPEPEIPSKYKADVELREDWQELEPPDWLTDLDREILALLGNHRLILTPSVIAKNIDRSRSSVSRRMNTLEAGGMVEKTERGHYRITEEGLSRMHEELPAEAPPGTKVDKDWTTWKIPTPEEVEEIEESGKLSW